MYQFIHIFNFIAVVESPVVVPQSTATAASCLSPPHFSVGGDDPPSYLTSGPPCLPGPHLSVHLPPHPGSGPEGPIDCPDANPSHSDNSSLSQSSHSPKPRAGKIWSLADTATKRHEQQHLHQQQQFHQQQQLGSGSWSAITAHVDDHPGATSGHMQQHPDHHLVAAGGGPLTSAGGTELAHSHRSNKNLQAQSTHYSPGMNAVIFRKMRR